MYKHYIRLDDAGRIIKGFSTAFGEPQDGDICINEDGGYQFRLEPDGLENPMMMDMDGISLYKYDGGAVVGRSADEIESDRAEIQQPAATPSIEERVAATESAIIAMMGGTI